MPNSPKIFLLLAIFAFFGTLSNAQQRIPGANDLVTIQFPNTPLPFILIEFEKLTGKRIVRDTGLETATLTIETSRPMTKSEAAEFIRKSLLLNGFVLIQTNDPDTLKIVTEAKAPSEGAPVIVSERDLPEGDQIVTFIMPLSHLGGEEAMAAFSTITPTHGYGQIAVMPDGQTLAIKDSSDVVRRYLELKAYIDVPTAEQITRAFDLERSDAAEVAENLSSLLGIGQQGVTAVAAKGGQQGKNVATLARRAEPKVMAIGRTNKVLVIAHPAQMIYIEGLIEEFDAPAEKRNYIMRPLRYLSVFDFLPVARDALLRGAAEDSEVPDFTTNRQTTSQVSSFGQNSANGFGGESGVRESLGEPTDIGGPQSLVVGHTLLIGDPKSNELFVSGPPEHLEIIETLLDRLDKKPRQIFLSTVIGQLTLGDNMNLGLDFVRTVDGFNVGGDPLFGAGSYRTRNVASSILDPSTLTNVAAFAAESAISPGLTMYGQIGDHLNVFLDALETSNRFSVLSRPSVFTLNNQKAVIQTGERVAVPVNTLSSLNTGTAAPSVASSIQFQDVVLRLEVIPLINSDDEVTLQISQVNDDIIGSTNIGGNDVPTIGTQEMRTTVIVPNKATVLLGGLISEDRRDTNSGLPFLTRIPLLKHLTGSTGKASNRQELLIFIQPHIVNGEEDLAESNADTYDRTELAENVLDFATSSALPVVLPPTAEVERIAVIEEPASQIERLRRQRPTTWKNTP